MFLGETVGDVGLAITQCYSLIRILQSGVRSWADLENQMTSTERVLEYAQIPEEDTSGRNITNWPQNGSLSYKDVNLNYTSAKLPILQEINFRIEPKQKVGIVGRTGAGKSTLISIIFRLYNFSGTVLIDDLDIKTVNIASLRSSISVIPQDPVLFTGNLRDNLDPYNLCSDSEIWKVLETTEMKHLFNTLDHTVEDGGLNFSIGQRQLLCLARAVLRKNKIVVMDEATSNMDPKTEQLMQTIIAEVFRDCTVITVAHRLHTIMSSDDVIVMESGRIVQNGPPNALLEDKDGIFCKLVHKSKSL